MPASRGPVRLVGHRTIARWLSCLRTAVSLVHYSCAPRIFAFVGIQVAYWADEVNCIVKLHELVSIQVLILGCHKVMLIVKLGPVVSHDKIWRESILWLHFFRIRLHLRLTFLHQLCNVVDRVICLYYLLKLYLHKVLLQILSLIEHVIIEA